MYTMMFLISRPLYWALSEVNTKPKPVLLMEFLVALVKPEISLVMLVAASMALSSASMLNRTPG